MNPTLEQLGTVGIIPVVTITNADNAEELARALLEGGLSSIEVTFRTEEAKNTIARIAKGFPSMLLGAGTVLSVDQVKTAVDHGAKYIVSPGLNRKVVEFCIQQKIPVTPGVATPTEVGAALDLQLEVVKFFPAELIGGVPFLKAISAPYRKIKFIPTGGIDESNLVSYLKLPNVLACGGSWMVKPELIINKQFNEIKQLTAQAVSKMLGFEMRRFGINNSNAEEAMKGASRLASLLQLSVKDDSASVLVGTQFEFLKQNALGTKGQIIIGTNFLSRAVAYLAKRGVRTKMDTMAEKGGEVAPVYLDMEIDGFAIRLVQT